jgi:EAL domain-containing protein (putative c-di-GMP-specific phosphodiesterase class I)
MFLQLGHCDEIQGYFFSKPVPAKEFEVLLSNMRTLPDEINAVVAGKRNEPRQ